MATMNIKAEEINEMKADLKAGKMTQSKYNLILKGLIMSHTSYLKGINQQKRLDKEFAETMRYLRYLRFKHSLCY